MEAHEVRLGNWYYGDSHGGRYFQITMQDIFDLLDGKLQEYHKPIPITEEWLERLGFQLVVEDGLRFWKITANGRTFKSLESILFTWEKYVHNLQNAVFASLQYELEMKNPA
jgi:hypothetical protein